VSEYYPRVRSLVSRPPIGFLNENLFGLVGGVAVEEEAGVVRSTLVSPSGTAPALSGLLVLNMPRWMRERAREHLSASRANLGRMWMALQNYATTRGHFPEGLDEFLGLFAPGEREEVFASPAAAAVLGPDAARRRSYRYIPGLSTMDEPGRPIVYEADAWHYEFMGMMPGAGDEPAETGAYVPWRLVLQLDGTIRAYPEEVFQREILPRIQANQ
jgi:hypothetical protein